MQRTIKPQFIDTFWDTEIIPHLQELIRIPNVSLAFDPEWEEKGFMEQAVRLVTQWLDDHKIPGSTLHMGRLPGRTPLLLLEIPGELDQTVLMYGHLDKQPAATGWSDGLGPWEPVLRDDKLYGRGTVDDCYSVYAAMAVAKAFKEYGVPAPRFLFFIECSEESGSPDVIPYCEHFASVIGTPDVIICLDAGGYNYEQMWLSTSMRGLLGGVLQVKVLEHGVHSGGASGLVPSSFRILRHLLSRIEETETGAVPEALQVKIPAQRIEQAQALAQYMGDKIVAGYSWAGATQPMTTDHLEQILNRSWRTTISYTGIDGLPSCQTGGNVLRPETSLKLSLRLPPTLSADGAAQFVSERLTKNPPYGAQVTFTVDEVEDGWDAVPLAPKLEQILTESSQEIYGKPPMYIGLGGSIPFLSIFGAKFPKAQFIVTGALGPKSNAHGPNEFLNIPFVKKLTTCLANTLARYQG